MTRVFASLALIIVIIKVLVLENLHGVGLATLTARHR
jgi:hypothetical protein